MLRYDHFMTEGEREIDYLCRLERTQLPTQKTSKEVTKLMVDFVLRNKMSLNGQKGNKYSAFREHGSDVPFIGGFGSRHQIARLLLGSDFNISAHAQSHINGIIDLYDKINFETQLLGEVCVIFSLKKDYKTLEDVEYIEFVYNFSLATDKNYYYNTAFLVRNYLTGNIFECSMESQEDMDYELIVSLTTSLNNFNDIFPAFINRHKRQFCQKLGLDVNEYNEDTNTLIQMIDF